MTESAEKGGGLYSFREVAFYLGVHPSTLRSWFFPGGNRKPLLNPKILKTDEDGAWLSFHDFLQAFAVKSLKAKGLHPAAVREAILEAKKQYGLPYPLSVKGHVIFVDDGGGVLIQPPGEEDPTELIGKRKLQRSFKKIVEPYIHRIDFDEEGIARRFIVFEEVFGNTKKRVVMDPATNFGEPTVEGTPYRVETLRRAVEAEGSVEAVANIYEVTENEVTLAMHAKDGSDLQIAA